MKQYLKVRGSQESVPNLEVNTDTVYIRTNITRIEVDGFVGWEYDENQYDIREYQELVGEATAVHEQYIIDVDFRLTLMEMGLV